MESTATYRKNRECLTAHGLNLERARIDMTSYRAMLEERGYRIAN